MPAGSVSNGSSSLTADVGLGDTRIYVQSRNNFSFGNWALVGSEYMYITGSAYNNGNQYISVTRTSVNATTHSSGDAVIEYTGGITSTFGFGSTSVNVADGTNIQDGDYIQIDNEIMNVGGVSGNLLTVTRGALGTTAAQHGPLSDVTIPALDWLFLGVTANGNDTGCTGACLYSYYIGGATPGNSTSGIAAAGGTSGIIIDNGYTSDGASQVYYTTLSPQSCTGNSVPKGAGTGTCAIQASQSGLN